jgi:Phosphotransferase enzyme family
VLRLETNGGRLYFKANAESLAHEIAVTELLIRRRPDLLPELVASNRERGWMLLRDAGTQLSSLLERDRDLRYWLEALPAYAELQIDVAPDGDELARLFPLDRRLATMSAHHATLVEATGALRLGLPDGLTVAEHRRLRELAPSVRAWSEELAASSIPETIQNDDFTHGSIFLDAGRYRFLDWGDACVSHPFFTLTVTLRVVEWVHELPPGSPEGDRVRDAYLEPWTRFETRRTLLQLAQSARRLGQVCRAALWLAGGFEHEPDDVAWSARLIVDPDAWRGAT